MIKDDDNTPTLPWSAVTAGDTGPALQDISQLPLEKRYLRRLGSTLKWAFVDLDDLSIEADTETLSRQDLRKS